MAYKVLSSCGGLRYNTADFKEINGVLTGIGAGEELFEEPMPAMCGGGAILDNGYFAVVYIENRPVVTRIGTTEVQNCFASNCSLLFDADKFDLDEDKALSLK